MGNRRSQGAWVSGAGIALLCVLSLVLRSALGIETAMDVDAINFGLSAFSFDVLQWRPHPPGYPGYVLLLQLLHGLAPGLSPLEVARLGSQLCGVASVPAAHWAARQMIRGEEDSSGWGIRPLAAAAFATVSPILWYYGADGQSHAAEGLATFLIFGLAVRAQTRRTRWSVVLAVAALACAGALHPNIPALGAPLALWLLWRRPWQDWLLGLGAAALITVTWALPALAAAGGWNSYARASQSLYGPFFHSFSVLGGAGTASLVAVNLNKALWAMAWAAPSLLALSLGGAAARTFRAPWLAVVLANLAFYVLVYTAEPGYFAGVAALFCLAPAAWPSGLARYRSIPEAPCVASAPGSPKSAQPSPWPAAWPRCCWGQPSCPGWGCPARSRG